MSRWRQQGTVYQLSLFTEGDRAAVRPGAGGEGGTESAAFEESQEPTVLDQQRALTSDLMERVCDPKNLNQAYKRVKSNGGAPGVDGRSVTELRPWLAEHKQELIHSLLEGSYHPELVREVEIPKPHGGQRQLGIPTVVDRLVQQAILQVLEPILDPTFSSSSFGFRLGRSAHQALPRPRPTSPTGVRSSWISTWRRSSIGSTT